MVAATYELQKLLGHAQGLQASDKNDRMGLCRELRLVTTTTLLTETDEAVPDLPKQDGLVMATPVFDKNDQTELYKAQRHVTITTL